ncbi:Hypothetical predicted protein [Olea europaea subsp. europaea]|uniref:Uncharacterized protein n=1 Tax=Olea europaea subsp. europaea TaxID=158383 RepID=A0A8S0UJD9_OLEEU|nr:Hypothetical predicted protein [Olea europaea subsp. europaea]
MNRGVERSGPLTPIATDLMNAVEAGAMVVASDGSESSCIGAVAKNGGKEAVSPIRDELGGQVHHKLIQPARVVIVGGDGGNSSESTMGAIIRCRMVGPTGRPSAELSSHPFSFSAIIRGSDAVCIGCDSSFARRRHLKMKYCVE